MTTPLGGSRPQAPWTYRDLVRRIDHIAARHIAPHTSGRRTVALLFAQDALVVAAIRYEPHRATGRIGPDGGRELPDPELRRGWYLKLEPDPAGRP